MNFGSLPAKPLVNLTAEYRNSSDVEADNSIEAAFRIPGYNGLRLDTSNWSREATNFFAARSARTPENLLNHVQRIMHHIQLKRTEEVYGALLDLFIVLKNHGHPLRARMLQYARPLLRAEQYIRLHRLLDNKKWDMFALPSSSCSILSNGLRGSRPLVEKNFPASDARYNPLSESRAYLENGQLKAARLVLETAVINGSSDIDIHTDLLSLYRRTFDKVHFFKTYPQLQIQQKSLEILWQELKAFFASDKS